MARIISAIFTLFLSWSILNAQTVDTQYQVSLDEVLSEIEARYNIVIEYPPEMVAITGGSGGGSQTMLVTAMDNRIKVSAPVVMLSCYFYGGCPCESGMPVHLCGNGTNNVELAGMAAPRPQLIISDGQDWTDHVPGIEFPYLQNIYGYYDNIEGVQNIHLENEGHDYGISKRRAMYQFMAEHLGLDINRIQDEKGEINESSCVIKEEKEMYVFGEKGEYLPAHAIRNFAELEELFYQSIVDPELTK